MILSNVGVSASAGALASVSSRSPQPSRMQSTTGFGALMSCLALFAELIQFLRDKENHLACHLDQIGMIRTSAFFLGVLATELGLHNSSVIALFRKPTPEDRGIAVGHEHPFTTGGADGGVQPEPIRVI